jgi:hypothetical protein
MGGSGSGYYLRSGDKKSCVEDCIVLNLFKLRELITWNGRGSGILWSNEKCWMNYTLQENVLTLSYLIKQGDKRVPIDEHIPISRTYPHFGGARIWMHCPNCNRRVGKLYLAPGLTRYLCRGCADLTYRSRQEHTHNELFNLMQQLIKSRRALLRSLQ